MEGIVTETNVEASLDWYLTSEHRVRLALARRLNNPADIDDLAQEVFLRLLRVPRPLVQNPEAYLYRMALNVAEDWRARAVNARDHSAPVEQLAASEEPEGEVAQREQDSTIQRALDSLPFTARTAVLLHVVDGLSYYEVAAHMGVSRRAVQRYVSKGYEALRDILPHPGG